LIFFCVKICGNEKSNYPCTRNEGKTNCKSSLNREANNGPFPVKTPDKKIKKSSKRFWKLKKLVYLCNPNPILKIDWELTKKDVLIT